MEISPDYHCFGKIIHTGPKHDAGHYYCEMRENIDKNQWYLFNDKEVKKTTDYSYIYQFEDLTPYMCFYKRKDE
jgi:ubiquitin C-terminal hydrolase